jgi:hypothetical protein
MCYLSALLLGQYMIQALIHCVGLHTIYIGEKHIFFHIMRLSNPRGRLRQSSIADHIASATGSTKESGQEVSTLFPCSSVPGDPSLPGCQWVLIFVPNWDHISVVGSELDRGV